MDEEGVNCAIIGACSPRVYEREFNGLGLTVLERANLREQVVWCHEPNDEDTQMLAQDVIIMACARAKRIEPCEAFVQDDFSKKILVVGGGVTGMTAAVEAARAGYEVSLVEKEAELGGYARKLHRVTPSTPPYRDLEVFDFDSLKSELEAETKLTVLTGAEIESIAGSPCLFDAKIAQNGATIEDRFGAIVLATGANPYDPSKLDNLGYGRLSNVVTNVQMEEMVSEGKFVRPSDGGEINKVVFIQCAGSRSPDHLPYCSNHCCATSLKQALYVHDENEEAEIFVIHRDIRTPGKAEEFYRAVQEKGVTLIRGEIQEVGGDDSGIEVNTTDVLLGEDVLLDEVDLVVLATGLVPATKTDFDDQEETSAEGDEEAVTAPPATALHLDYRQGPELPNFKYGFPDSHFICFPYETRRSGIYAAGTVRRPGDIETSRLDAAGAALKAIQSVELISKGLSAHPRVGDLSYPELFMDRCTQCKRCTEECPFGAYNEDEKGNPLPNPTRCRRCGICMGACPERVISFKNYSVPMTSDMFKALEVPDEFDEKPRVLCFVCENDAYPALDMVGMQRKKYSSFVRFISLRCLGSLNLQWISDALNRGFDGILLLGCKHGDDYQCHFVKGSELADIRMAKIAETLERLMLESERIRVEQVAITDVDRIPEIIDEFMETIEEVGPNPFKGM